MPVTELPRLTAAKTPEEEPKSAPRPGPSLAELASWSLEDLIDLRARIDAHIPIRSLKDVNIERELVLQLLAVQRLQNDVLADTDTPANQRAQTAGQVASTLQMLGKLQTEVYTSERVKKLEQILIDVLQSLPEDAQLAFQVAYRTALGEAS